MITELETLVWSRVMPQTPVGPLTIMVSSTGLVQIEFGILPDLEPTDETIQAMLNTIEAQLNEYFTGTRKVFDLPIDWSGLTPYQEKVLRACYDLPYGEVKTYGQLAQETGNPKGARAVGSFMASNPLPLVIPCHRVVGSDGHLHGYGAPGGLETKTWLLELEGRQVINQKLKFG